MNHYMIAGFLTFVTNSIIAIVVLRKNIHGKLNRYFALFSLSAALYGLGFSLQGIATSPAQEMLAIRLILTGAIFVPISFLQTVYALLNKTLSRKIVFLLYFVGIFFEVINWFTELLARDPVPRFSFQYLFQRGPLYTVLAIFFLIIAIVVLVTLFKGYSTAIGIKRNQLKYFFIGTLIEFVGGTPGFILGYNIELYPINPYGAYCVPVYCIITAYILIKYRLMGFRGAVRALFAPLIAMSILVILSVLFQNMWWNSIKRFFQVDEIIVFIILSIFIFGIIHKFVLWLLDRISPQKNYSNLLYDYHRRLGLCTNHDQIFNHTLEILQDNNGPQPKSFAVLWKKGSTHPFVIQKCFGIPLADRKELSTNSALIALIEEEYIYKTDNADIAPVLVKDELYKAYSHAKIKNVLIELEAFQFQLCVPLIVSANNQERLLIGLLCLGDSAATDSYDKEDYIFFRDVAWQTAQAIIQVGARELVHVEKQEQYQERLVDASFKISEIPDVSVLAEKTIDIIRENLDLVYLSVYIYDPETGMYSCLAQKGDQVLSNCDTIHKEEYFVRFLQERKKPLFYRDLKAWAEQTLTVDMQSAREYAERLGAELIIPLAGKRLFGFIVLGKKRSGEDYSRSEWYTFILVANNMYMAVRNIIAEEEAIREPLTKLYNHGFFHESLVQIIAQSLRQKKPVSLIFADIDFFKKYNDTYGHSQGDIILKSFAHYLRKTSRVSDVVSRLGGEEFGIILPEINLEEAKNIAMRLREGMKRERVLSAITVSMGVASIKIDQETDVKTMTYELNKTRQLFYETADAQMYRAKKEGRDRICWADSLWPVYAEGKRGVKALRVLIIEDEEIIEHNLEHYLRLKGYDPMGKGTAEEGLELYYNEKPDVILLDIGLPDKDGRYVLKNIRQHDLQVHVGIITGHGDLKKEMLELGADKFFLKPLDFDEIERWLQDLAEKKC